jgi:hypothetical protein
MCSKRRDIKAELDGIFEGLLDSIEHAPAEEVAEDARAAGRDVASMAADAKRAALAGLKRFEQKKLNAARRACQYRADRNLTETLPTTPEDRRNMFHTILASNQELSECLTIQHRNFHSMSDDDISVMLEELCELGFFEDKHRNASE